MTHILWRSLVARTLTEVKIPGERTKYLHVFQATQHVRESQEEIQQAQAQRSDGGRHMEVH